MTNKLTREACLEIDVKNLKLYIAKKYENIFVKIKKSKKHIIVRTTAIIYFCAMVEKLLMLIIKKISKNNEDCEILSSTIDEFIKSDMMEQLSYVLHTFDKEESYHENIISFVEIMKICKNIGKISIKESGKNMLKYLVNYVVDKIIDFANIIRKRRDSLTITLADVKTSFKILFGEIIADKLSIDAGDIVEAYLKISAMSKKKKTDTDSEEDEDE